MSADKIALIGMPLAGKTTMIRELKGYDLDDTVENLTKMSVSDLLLQGTFREEETRALAYLVAQEKKLIALGGGAILKQQNIDLLREYFVVFLDTPLVVLLERLKTNERPLIKREADLRKLFDERYALYLKAADMHIDGVSLKRLFQEKIRL